MLQFKKSNTCIRYKIKYIIKIEILTNQLKNYQL